MELMDVVDKNDRVIGQATKQEIYGQRLAHRIAHVYIFDHEGRLAVQKRSPECSYCPLYWSMSAAGHVSAGESYEAAAERELQEELGVNLPLEFVGRELFLDPTCAETFIGVFKVTANGPFVLDPREVQEVAFFSTDEIKVMMKRGELFHPQFLHVWELIFSKR